MGDTAGISVTGMRGAACDANGVPAGRAGVAVVPTGMLETACVGRSRAPAALARPRVKER